jgi:diguanylate cyclase (GGDEF)-like protein
MPASSISANENERLADLRSHEILDTPEDPRVDNFVRLAAGINGVPMAMVSLVDEDRQWFKARIGIDMREAPRAVSFCTHAIRHPTEVMVVEDALKDARFADNALVKAGPRIRFYAGAPILSASGHALGTLCIIDSEPRTLDEPGRRRLADLANGVGSVLELHRQIKQISRAATHDQLTGLPNRTMFEPLLAEAAAASRHGDHSAVLCLDLDHFRAVNERFGHEGGDALLRECAVRLRATIRRKDVACRLGGDEFAVLMRGPLTADGPARLAARIMQALRKPIDIGGRIVRLRTSIGVAVAPSDGRDGPSLYRTADMALYEAKSLGDASLVFAASLSSPGLVRKRNTMVDDIRHALRHDEFTLNWQPYFSTRTGRIFGQEALIRWHRPATGRVDPGVFIPVAEQVGLIERIDAWVLRTACAAAVAWPGGQRVSVNISAESFSSGELTDLVVTSLRKTGLPADRLVLELTERTVINHPEAAQRQIAQLKGLGLKLALDDFGIGYSSLASLKSFEFDKLKLDARFVKDLGHDQRADDVARAVLALAKALRMSVCAEGIETETQLAFLKATGCEFLQGYLLARPSAKPVFHMPHALALAMHNPASDRDMWQGPVRDGVSSVVAIAGLAANRRDTAAP